MIVSETAEPCEHIITGIAGKKGMSVINIEKDKMNRKLDLVETFFVHQKRAM